MEHPLSKQSSSYCSEYALKQNKQLVVHYPDGNIMQIINLLFVVHVNVCYQARHRKVSSNHPIISTCI